LLVPQLGRFYSPFVNNMHQRRMGPHSSTPVPFILLALLFLTPALFRGTNGALISLSDEEGDVDAILPVTKGDSVSKSSVLRDEVPFSHANLQELREKGWGALVPYFPAPNMHISPYPHYNDPVEGISPEVFKKSFNSWGGKRDRIMDYFHRMAKGFNSWGGKRDPDSSIVTKNDYSPMKKVNFNPWGG